MSLSFCTTRECVCGAEVVWLRVRLHISLHTWHDDLPNVVTLLAGDWPWASTHTHTHSAVRPTLPHRHTLKSKLCNLQNSHIHLKAEYPANSTDSINKCLWAESARLQWKFYMSPLTDLSHVLTCSQHNVSTWPAPLFPILGTSLVACCKQVHDLRSFPLFWQEGACPWVNR